MNRTIATTILAAGCATALLLVGAAPALAAPVAASASTAGVSSSALREDGDTATVKAPRTLEAIKAAAAEKTSVRIDRLNAALTRIGSVKKVSAATRDSVTAQLQSDLAGMRELATTIAASTSAEQAAADYRRIFTDYRVLAVTLPTARMATAADVLQGATLVRLDAAREKIATKLAGPWASKSTPEIEASLASMTGHLDASRSGLDGLAARLIAVTPADYNADKTVVAPLRAELRSAAAELRQARRDARSILAALR